MGATANSNRARLGRGAERSGTYTVFEDAGAAGGTELAEQGGAGAVVARVLLGLAPSDLEGGDGDLGGQTELGAEEALRVGRGEAEKKISPTDGRYGAGIETDEKSKRIVTPCSSCSGRATCVRRRARPGRFRTGPRRSSSGRCRSC